MIRPATFFANPETAASNRFQHTPSAAVAMILARAVDELGFQVLLLALPDEEPLEFIRRLGDVAPTVRELVG